MFTLQKLPLLSSRFRSVALFAAALTCALVVGGPVLLAQPAPEVSAEEGEQVMAATSRPFARVRSAENGLTLKREEGYEEKLSGNGAIYVGDRAETNENQRAELQLPDGSLLRLNRSSAVELYDLGYSDSADGERTIIALRWGQIQATVPEPHEGDSFRIDSPAASIYPLRRSSIRVDIEPDETTRITVEKGRVEVAGQGGSVILRAGERTRVRAGQAPIRPYDVIVQIRDGFGLWIDQRDQMFAVQQAPGEEYDSLPEEVRPYYGELSQNGTWIHDEEYGWVWDPDVDEQWRPYEDGEWIDGPYGPVWSGAEPWSWSVYRYGRWDMRAGRGWCWIPGRVFRPAHVWWYYGPDYVGWCPIGFYDSPVHISVGWSWGHHYFDHHPWTFLGYNHFYWHHVPSHRYHRTHAGRVRPRPQLDRGVVGRDAVATRAPRQSTSRPVRDGARRGRGLDPSAYETARRRAGRRGSSVRTVEEAGRQVRDRGTARETDRRNFRDRERIAGTRPGRERQSRDGVTKPGRVEGSRNPARRAGRPGSSGSGAASAKPPARTRPVVRVRTGDQVKGDKPSAGSRAPSGRNVPAPVAPRRGVSRRPSSRESQGSPADRSSRGRSEESSVRRMLGRVGEERGSRSGQRSAGTASSGKGQADKPTTRRPPQSRSGRAQQGTTQRPPKAQAPARKSPPRTAPSRSRAPSRRDSGSSAGKSKGSTPTRSRAPSSSTRKSSSGSSKARKPPRTSANRSGSSSNKARSSANRSGSSSNKSRSSANKSRSSSSKSRSSASKSRSSSGKSRSSASKSRSSSGKSRSSSGRSSRSSGSRSGRKR